MLKVRNHDVCNVMFHGCNLQIGFIVHFFRWKYAKGDTRKKKPSFLAWEEWSEDIGDLYVKNVKTLN
jgi:hypothetical protein